MKNYRSNVRLRLDDDAAPRLLKVKITHIKWDLDDEMKERRVSYKRAASQLGLPESFELSLTRAGESGDEEEIMEAIEEAIDAEYGFCFKGYEYRIAGRRYETARKSPSEMA